MRATSFSIDTLGTRAFEGYTRGDLWNGWARPFFPFGSARQLVAAFQQQGQSAHYDEALDAFVFTDEATGEREEFGSVEIEGHKLYPIGAGSWIWEEVEEVQKGRPVQNYARQPTVA